MKKLYFKKWYQAKKYRVVLGYAEEEEVLANLYYAGQTEKAIKAFYVDIHGRIETIWVPKGAVLVAESEEEYNEMDKKENNEIALIRVNEFLSSEHIHTFAEAKEYAEKVNCLYR